MNKTVLIGRIRSQNQVHLERSGDVVVKNVTINGRPSVKIFQRDPLWTGFKAVSRAWDKICGNRNLTEEYEFSSNALGATSESREDMRRTERLLRDIHSAVNRKGVFTIFSKTNDEPEKKFLDKLFLNEIPDGKVYFKMDEAFAPGELKESANKLLKGCADYSNFEEGLDWIEKCRSYSLDHKFTHAEREHVAILSLRIENQIEKNLKDKSAKNNDPEFLRVRRMLNEIKNRIDENAVGVFGTDLNKFISDRLFPEVGKRWLNELLSDFSALRLGFGDRFYFDHRKIDTLLHHLNERWEDLFDKDDQHASVKAELMPTLIRIVDTFDEQKSSREFPEYFSTMMAELRTKIER